MKALLGMLYPLIGFYLATRRIKRAERWAIKRNSLVTKAFVVITYFKFLTAWPLFGTLYLIGRLIHSQGRLTNGSSTRVPASSERKIR